MDEHPHTVALRARDPRALAAGGGGLAARALAELRRRGRVADRADRAARRVLRRAARRRRSRRASPRCTRPTRTWSRCSGTWWRDEGHARRPLPFAARRRARVFDLALEGMVWSRRSLLMALLLGAARRVRARCTACVAGGPAARRSSTGSDLYGSWSPSTTSATCCRWPRSSTRRRSSPTRWRARRSPTC